MKNMNYKIQSCVYFAAVFIVANSAMSAGNNTEHEIMVYSIEQYQEFWDSCEEEYREWKQAIGLLFDEQDPYKTFWNLMYSNCSGDQCAHENSVRRKNSEVTVDSMVNISDGWEDADMVFFFGHNTQIKPHIILEHEFGYWRDVSGFAYCHESTDDYREWGTSSMPYEYHYASPIMNASETNQRAVFYAYNGLTSVLVGQDFISGLWRTENTLNQAYNEHSGMLGPETEWVIAHGCNAVQGAKLLDNNEVVPISNGVYAWCMRIRLRASIRNS